MHTYYVKEYASDRAKSLLKKIEALTEGCHRTGVTQDMLLTDWQEVAPKELAYTNFSAEPDITGTATFPYLNQDGTPTGGVGFSYMQFALYHDGTGIAWNRQWYYDSMYPDRPTMSMSGKPCIGDRCKGDSNYMVVKFYAFGCKHEWRSMDKEELDGRKIVLYRCEHAHICKKCGHHEVWDSSD